MKTIVTGDIHGSDIWKQIIADNPDVDRYIFMGDYFDTFESTSTAEQIFNFNAIIEFKRTNSDKVIVLYGNHDYHYLRGVSERYSGYQRNGFIDIQEALDNAKDVMQIAYQEGLFLFTHAGVSNDWLRNTGYDFESKEPIADYINELFKYKLQPFGFLLGKTGSLYGDDTTQGPLWIRHKSLIQVGQRGYVQVIGHTPSNNVQFLDRRIICVDALPYQYLLIEDNKCFVKQLKPIEY